MCDEIFGALFLLSILRLINNWSQYEQKPTSGPDFWKKEWAWWIYISRWIEVPLTWYSDQIELTSSQCRIWHILREWAQISKSACHEAIFLEADFIGKSPRGPRKNISKGFPRWPTVVCIHLLRELSSGLWSWIGWGELKWAHFHSGNAKLVCKTIAKLFTTDYLHKLHFSLKWTDCMLTWKSWNLTELK